MDAKSDPKESNPKQAIGTKKAPMSTVSAVVLAELGVAMLSGAVKYGRHNYRVAGARASTYYDAFNRHTKAWWEGQDTDPDSGMPHLIMAMGCIAVLRDAQIQGVETDDRPPKSPDGWLDELNRRTADILEKYPEPVKAFTEANTVCKQDTERPTPAEPLKTETQNSIPSRCGICGAWPETCECGK